MYNSNTLVQDIAMTWHTSFLTASLQMSYQHKYCSLPVAYDYSRYQEYMRTEPYMGGGGGYAMTGYPERTANAYANYAGYRGGYDMSSYGTMYGNTAATMGAYTQAASNYGPMKGYGGQPGGAPAGDRDRGGAARQAFHPYRR